MFSDIAHHQQHHFPQSSYSLHHNASRDPSPTLFTDPLLDRHVSPVQNAPFKVGPAQNASFKQRIEKPQQYAHPLRSRATLPQQLPVPASYLPITESSEHMLRRKTPNGTLAAGYDGSPVEWTKRSHATKHFLTPSSKKPGHATYTRKSTVDSRNYVASHRDQPLESNVGEHLHLHPYSHDNRGERHADASLMDDTKANHRWGSSTLSLVGRDSVLDQSPIFHPIHDPAGSRQVPTVLQPMWPPCLGPISIQNPRSYEPHRPNGAFGSYRPASLQDSRFQGLNAEHRTSYSAQLQPAVNNYGQWLQAHSDSQHPHSSDYSLTSGPLPGRERDELMSPNSRFDSSSRRNSFRNGEAAANSQFHGWEPLAYRDKPSSWKDQGAQMFNENFNNPELAVSGLFAASLSMPQNSVLTENNVQFKEKILVWAHRIYGNLLASVEQTRRNSTNEQNNAGSQLQSRFPSPIPRRPYPFWSGGRNLDIQLPNIKARAYAPSQVGTKDPDQNSRVPNCHGKTLSDGQALPCKSSSDHAQSLFNGASCHRWHSHDEFLRFHTLGAQPSYVPPQLTAHHHVNSPSAAAMYALEMLGRLCQESSFEWTDGLLLTGCLAYGLGDYNKAMKWYLKVLQHDPDNVEAMSNLAATLLALNRRDDAEHHWFRCVKLRPTYFEAVEHLIGLLHEGRRGREAVRVIEYVEHALRTDSTVRVRESSSRRASDGMVMLEKSLPVSTDRMTMCDSGSSGYAIPSSDNGRMLSLVHGKGNMLYQIGDNAGAAQAFEDAILIGAGRRQVGIRGLIEDILRVFSDDSDPATASPHGSYSAQEPILLAPDMALETSRLVFPPHGRLPGLDRVPDGFSQKAAVSIVSNSLLSLAKIYQDGMSSSGATATAPRATSGVQEILALYYLSLSLQPSPSTANNVGILLASVQQSARSKTNVKTKILQCSTIPGVTPGSGIALALAYYDYGLKLDTRHAHLYTNLGSLFKDIGQLQAAIKMYEKAVECDGSFDIALANLANAVKDQGRVSDAIVYYKRAVASNPDFAEAVCGLANALNSVCSWSGRGGIHCSGSSQDRWHVDERGDLYDAKKSVIPSRGWIERVVAIVEKQLQDGEGWGRGVLYSIGVERMLQQLGLVSLCNEQIRTTLRKTLEDWAGNQWEGAKVVRFIERASKNLVRQIYLRQYIHQEPVPSSYRVRPQLPAALAVPSAPTVLPFHTFTCPLSAKQIRKISQRNGLRVSCSTLRAPWLPGHVFDPPAPPDPHLNVGYISSDFNNHPLAHLMQSVFGLHDRSRVKAFCYATAVSDGSVHRQQIEREAPVFHDASSWSIDRLVQQVVNDDIHILVNLNGYTRGAKNEVFAARPAPVQMSFMGFAGTLGAEWCDYLLADKIAIPPQTLRPWRGNVDLADQTKDGNNDDDHDDWVYGENIIFTRDTFFCCDHRQSAPDSQEVQVSWPEEQQRRWIMRKELFPDLSDDAVILGNFNQLYKVRRPSSTVFIRNLLT